MAQYLLSVCHPNGFPDMADLDPEVLQRLGTQVGAVNEAMTADGVWVFGGGLVPPASATVVKAAGDTVTMTDGPFIESKECIGGFWIIDVPDLDVALEWATRASAACEEAVEVRPFQAE